MATRPSTQQQQQPPQHVTHPNPDPRVQQYHQYLHKHQHSFAPLPVPPSTDAAAAASRWPPQCPASRPAGTAPSGANGGSVVVGGGAPPSALTACWPAQHAQQAQQGHTAQHAQHVVQPAAQHTELPAAEVQVCLPVGGSYHVVTPRHIAATGRTGRQQRQQQPPPPQQQPSNSGGANGASSSDAWQALLLAADACGRTGGDAPRAAADGPKPARPRAALAPLAATFPGQPLLAATPPHYGWGPLPVAPPPPPATMPAAAMPAATAAAAVHADGLPSCYAWMPVVEVSGGGGGSGYGAAKPAAISAAPAPCIAPVAPAAAPVAAGAQHWLASKQALGQEHAACIGWRQLSTPGASSAHPADGGAAWRQLSTTGASSAQPADGGAPMEVATPHGSRELAATIAPAAAAASVGLQQMVPSYVPAVQLALATQQRQQQEQEQRRRWDQQAARTVLPQALPPQQQQQPQCGGGWQRQQQCGGEWQQPLPLEQQQLPRPWPPLPPPPTPAMCRAIAAGIFQLILAGMPAADARRLVAAQRFLSQF